MGAFKLKQTLITPRLTGADRNRARRARETEKHKARRREYYARRRLRGDLVSDEVRELINSFAANNPIDMHAITAHAPKESET